MATRRGGKAAKRGRAKKKPPARQWRQDAAHQLSGHAGDALAIALAVSGVVLALGLMSDLAGPVGDALDTATAVIFGKGRVMIPIALIVAAVFVALDHRVEEESRRAWRLGLGFVLTGATVVGLLHLTNGNPDGESLEPLREAGGVMGVLGSAGAVIVLIAAGLLGLLLIIGAGLRDVAHWIVAAFAWTADHAKALTDISLSPTPVDDEDAPLRVRLYDQYLEPDIDLVAAEA
jgi:hypothetical protein